MIASLHYLKAQIYGYEQNSQGAESELRKTLELDSNYINAYSALGALFVNTKQGDRAIAEYQKILDKRPDNSAAYTLIGMLYDARQDYTAAADHYRKALEKDQGAIIAANNLAWLYAVQGRQAISTRRCGSRKVWFRRTPRSRVSWTRWGGSTTRKG